MRIRFALKSLMRNKGFTFLLVVQLTFAFFALYNTIQINEKVYTEASRITNYFKDREICTIPYIDGSNQIFDNPMYPKVNKKTLKRTLDFLNSSTEFIFTHQVIFPLTIQTFEGHEPFKEYKPETNIDGKKFFQAKAIVVNKNAIDTFKPLISEGRLFSSEEYDYEYGKDHVIPIIVGAEYSKNHKVGDELNVFLGGPGGLQKAKIVGILGRNQFIPIDMNAIGKTKNRRYMNLDYCIIGTYTVFMNSDYILYDTMFGYNFIMIDANKNDKEVINNIKKVFYDNLGLKISVRNLDKYINQELDTFVGQGKIMETTAFTIFIFVFLTMVVSTLNSIVKRKKEFGVHIFSGGMRIDIALSIFYEISMVIFMAFIVTVCFIYYNDKIVDIKALGMLFLGAVSLSGITAILPMWRILGLSVNDIIKGAE